MATERDEQAALFDWAEWQGNITPELKLLYAIPNGQYRPGQAMEPGLKAGVPDICLPVARGGYHSLYVELKVGSNSPSKEQKRWITSLRKAGHRVDVCWGYEAAKETILDYLDKE